MDSDTLSGSRPGHPCQRSISSSHDTALDLWFFGLIIEPPLLILLLLVTLSGE